MVCWVDPSHGCVLFSLWISQIATEAITNLFFGQGDRGSERFLEGIWTRCSGYVVYVRFDI